MQHSPHQSARRRLLNATACALALGLAHLPSWGQNKTVILVSDTYPPYVMDEGADKGYITEMAIKVFQNAGYKAQYVNVPFKRALVGLGNGDYDGLLAVSPGRKNFVYPKNAFGLSQTTFFALKTSKWEFKGVDSLGSVTLGVINGYEYDGELKGALNSYIEKNKNNSKLIQENSGTQALVQNIKKLESGRIDTMAEDTAVFWYSAKQAGMADKFKAVGNLTTPQPITVGFDLSNPRAKELAKVLSDGVKRLKDSGDYDKILDKYGLKASN
jgi:polar amino acid transport system substrate-binding protein